MSKELYWQKRKFRPGYMVTPSFFFLYDLNCKIVRNYRITIIEVLESQIDMYTWGMKT
jgi:hypothetical protein